MARLFRYAASPLLAIILLASFQARHVVADQRDFTVINGTAATTFTELYVAPSSSSDWEDDILGGDTLRPTERINVHFGRFNPSTCMYDIKVVGKDGTTGELDNVDLCSTTTVTFHD
jgi:hypothetical protein